MKKITYILELFVIGLRKFLFDKTLSMSDILYIALLLTLFQAKMWLASILLLAFWVFIMPMVRRFLGAE